MHKLCRVLQVLDRETRSLASALPMMPLGTTRQQQLLMPLLPVGRFWGIARVATLVRGFHGLGFGMVLGGVMNSTHWGKESKSQGDRSFRPKTPISKQQCYSATIADYAKSCLKGRSQFLGIYHSVSNSYQEISTTHSWGSAEVFGSF